MTQYLNRHPFIKTLLKIISVIVLSFGTFIGCIIGLLIIVILSAALLAGPSENVDQHLYGDKDSQNKLLSIPIKGVILGQKSEDSVGDLFGGEQSVYGYDIKESIEQAIDDESIKGVILEVDSPGGTIYGSHAIVDGVEKYKKETGNPVFAHVSGMAASGAYWTVTAADTIIADYGSLVGSIGVIFGPFQYYDKVLSENGGLLGGGVTTENGIESFYFTAGKYKDFGNPYRRISAEETKNAQDLVDNEYTEFVNRVSYSRKINSETIRNTIGALIYDNKKAFDLKLIDGTGNKDETYIRLARAAKIKDNDFQVVEAKKEYSGLEGLLQSYMPNRATPKVLSLCAKRTLLSYYGDFEVLCK